MKRIITIFALILLGATAMAQKLAVPPPNSLKGGNITGQMLNLSNTYVGSRLDSLTNATTKYFNICQIRTTTGLPVNFGLYDKGKLSIIVSGLKISGTPAGTVTVEQSFDGVTWAPVRTKMPPRISGVSTDTTGVIYTSDATYTYQNPDEYTIVNTSAAQGFSIDLDVKYGYFYRVNITTTGTQVSSWTCWYNFIRD